MCVCVYTSFSFDFFLRPSLRFSSVRISTATSSRDSPTTELSSLFFTSRMSHVIAGKFFESSAGIYGPPNSSAAR